MNSYLDRTMSYYDSHALIYIEKTLSVDMGKIYKKFLNNIVEGGRILDAGSGSGRDSLNFLGQGYRVEAFDASPRLAALSTQLTGVATRVLRFQELDIVCRYDGIWACASLLHLKTDELVDAFQRLQRALKPNCTIYASFKAGTEERVALDGRWFTDMNEERIKKIVEGVPQLSITDMWLTPGEGAFCGHGEWFNLLLRQTNTDYPS
jgi:SAM-dependent methyltransferase